jgi:Zn-dependent peptidase ImmA (M78 family)
MDELVVKSSTGEISISMRWASAAATTAAEATRGRLRVVIRHNPVWYGESSDEGFDWPWIDLLEFLGDSWRFLELEEGTPLGVPVDTAPRMLAAAESLLNKNGLAALVDREFVAAFANTHDLSQGVQGANLPPIWVVRDGSTGWLCTSSWVGHAPIGELVEMITRLGDHLAKRLETVDDVRGNIARERWESRMHLSRLEIIEAVTGFPIELVTDVESAFLDAHERDWSVPKGDVLLAAARLLGPLPLETLGPILVAVRDMPRTSTPTLDVLSRAARGVLDGTKDAPPFEQGYELASWLRQRPGVVDEDGTVDPRALLRTWLVPVRSISLGLAELDAIGCWGDGHGPGIVVNTDGRHSARTPALRATLAHEISHLLVDREGSLPLAEVLGGRTPLQVEQRARAFAAELLLPRSVAVEQFDQSSNDDLSARFAQLTSTYGVSAELAAWQIRNAGAPITAAARQFLNAQVKRPSQY